MEDPFSYSPLPPRFVNGIKFHIKHIHRWKLITSWGKFPTYHTYRITHTLYCQQTLSGFQAPLSQARSQPANRAVDETNSCEENVFRIEHLTRGSQDMGPLDGADTERPQRRPVRSVLHQPRPRNSPDNEHPVASQGCNSMDI